MNLLIEQKKAEAAVTRALAAVIPSHWTRANLEIRLEVRPDGRLRMNVSVSSPEGNSEKTAPPEAFFQAAESLLALLVQQKKQPKLIAFTLEKATDASWGARVKYR
ncbi:MAG: hypothetical protein QM765_53075 [Myxococcales bacterium]